MFKLVIQDDEGKTTVVPLIRDEITIGRKEGNTIRLTERNVSRRHARILRNNGEVQIEDLGSYNGIRVNNARIAERVSLRVSDQVQIGDYKLYLKAEGVEQVDDARTMPIERIDNALPTEVMPAMNGPATQPMPAPAAMAGGAQPNRSPVAVADTDPAGRPVATTAQVAALTQPVGYGKLVVISSNLAGKEFDLTRPQMIVGRTDENDIVVNHRSISRNHAKVTRDPETGRYTISDLQSSNGVRVNGQDYGKVELRRGDTVDLGHVRLRFVEPGEDFVFSRDAVIADVPEAGGKKGMLVAILLAVLVLGGVGAFFAFKGRDSGNVASGSQQGSTTGGSNDVVAENGSDDENGSGGTNVVAPPDNAPDAQQMVTPPNDVAGELTIECKQFAVDKKWTDAISCADRLAQHDPKAAKAMRAQYKDELENELTLGRVGDAVNKNDLGRAKKELAQIEDTSVYRDPAAKLVEDLQNNLITRYHDEALAMKRSGKCDGYDRLLAEALNKGGPDARAAVLREKCETQRPSPPDCSERLADNTRACKQQFCSKNPGDSRCGGGAVNVTSPANCDAEALKEKGMQNINMGQHAAALAQFEASLKCKRDSYVIQLAFMEACSSSNSGKAKYYYKQLTPAQQQKFAQICIRQKVDYE
ncbi:MAG TPA: FHA domain-containing protein [Kofleriaceae bacterium]|nr:FHA domain-containing protein [Kofleriaceae bacterium]